MVLPWSKSRDYFKRVTLTFFLRVVIYAHLTTANEMFPYDVNTPTTNDDLQLVLDPKTHEDAAVLSWDHSTTSSISVNWSLATHRNGSVFSAQVNYVLPNGQFKSDMLPPEVQRFTFNHLNVATTYRICVKLYERIDKRGYYDTLEHYTCAYMSTLPYIRRDSVLALLLTLGYFLFLSLIAYINWRKDIVAARKRRRRHSSRNDPASHVIRWREVAERQRLCIPTSIEEDGPHDL